jgi:tripartite-type tricarboxylate transporter receptor subunit TctC
VQFHFSFKAFCLSLAVLSVSFSGALFAAYPDRPIKMVVPYPPGGSTDIVARAVGQKLSELMSTQVVIENKGGASGMIGAVQVAKSPADGYTLLMTASGPHSINVSLFKDIAYDPIKDFAPVILTAVYPLLMVVNAEHPAKNVQEFIAWARTNKGKVNFCSIGPGTPSHLAGELFQSMAGVEMTHIPYKGSSQAITDMLAGQCSVLFDSALSSGPQVKGGKLRALAIGSKDRVDSWAEIPTVSESGLTGYEAYTWSALVAPAATPKTVIDLLNAESAKVLATPAFREMIKGQGAVVGGGSPEDLARFTQSEIAKWGKVIRDGKITAQQ